MQTMTVSEAKATLSSLLERVLAGEEVAIGRRGRPEVVLRPYADDGEPRPLGQYDGPYRLDTDFFTADEDVERLFPDTTR